MKCLCLAIAVGVVVSLVHGAPATQQQREQEARLPKYRYILFNFPPKYDQHRGSKAMEAKRIDQDNEAKAQLYFPWPPNRPIFLKRSMTYHKKRKEAETKPISGTVRSLQFDGEAELQQHKLRNILKKVVNYYKMHHEDSDNMAVTRGLPKQAQVQFLSSLYSYSINHLLG